MTNRRAGGKLDSAWNSSRALDVILRLGLKKEEEEEEVPWDDHVDSDDGGGCAIWFFAFSIPLDQC